MYLGFVITINKHAYIRAETLGDGWTLEAHYDAPSECSVEDTDWKDCRGKCAYADQILEMSADDIYKTLEPYLEQWRSAWPSAITAASTTSLSRRMSSDEWRSASPSAWTAAITTFLSRCMLPEQ